jgi:superkiller protein 3
VVSLHFQLLPKETSSSDVLINEGVNALQRNDLTVAKSKFLKAIELNPKDATAYIYLGIIEDRSGDFKSAESRFAAAVRADPHSPSAHNNHGASLLKLGRTKEAATEFVTSLNIDSNQPNALVNLAQLRLASGSTPELNEALGLFEHALNSSPMLKPRALVVVSLRRGKREAATNYYRQYTTFVTQQGDQAFSSASRAELGAALLENELTAEAILELTAGLNAEPSNVETILRLGKAHIAANNIPMAGRVLEGAVARGIDNAAIYALLASVYEKSGHMEHAIPAMRLAIQKDPQSEQYRFSYGMLLIGARTCAVIRLKKRSSCS